MRNATFASPAFALILAIGGCSPAPEEPSANAANIGAVESAAPAVAPESVQNGAIAPAGPARPEPVAARVIGLEGLGDLRIGQAVPDKGSWKERGAQTSDACRTVSSPDFPGVYAIVSEGKVRRITVGKRSDVKLVEGVGVGATEADVKKWFAGFRESPHKYEEAPAKYLTAPNAASGDPALRFEIGHEGKVGLIHVGTMPVLAYVEGCG